MVPDFKNMGTLKILYYAFVRSYLEFGMIIRDSISKKHSKIIEKYSANF